MLKPDYIKAIQAELQKQGVQLPLTTLKAVVDASHVVLTDLIVEGDSYQCPLGTFKRKVVPESTGVFNAAFLPEGDPRIGQQWVKPAHYGISFKASNSLKTLLDAQPVEE